MRRFSVFFVGALAAAALACNLPSQVGSPSPTASPQPPSSEPPSAEPASTEAPVPPTEEATETVSSEVAVPSGDDSGEVNPPVDTQPVYGEALYETSFKSGWPDISTDHGSSSVVDGAYRFEVGADWAHWVFTSQATQSVFYAELTAQPVACLAGDDAYGLIFQYESSSSFRFFAVTCDNQYILGERAGTRNRAVVSGSLPEGSNMAEGEHIIAVWAHDSTISGYADGSFVDSATFETMPAGDIGPYAETGDDSITVDFSRLVVYGTGDQ